VVVTRDESPLRDRMVFLVGAQRSGTNWLQRLLATHPDVVALPSETQLFTVGIEVLAERVQHGVLSSTSTASVFMERREFVAAARAFCDTAFAGVADRLHPGARRVVERSPNHVEHLALIGEVYPDAWFVHIVRDGRDVARSLVSQRWGPRTVEDAADLWARSIRSARAAAPGLARYREVRYEDLLVDAGSGLAELFAFLGLDGSADVVAAVLGEAGVAYNTDRRRPEIGDGKWRDEWSRRDVATFDRVAGDVLDVLGYDTTLTPRRGRLAPLRAARTRVRRSTERPAPAVPTRPHLPMEVRQRRVDALCAALAAGNGTAAGELLAPDATVRLVSADTDERRRGEAARTLLAECCAAGGPWGEQVRGDVHVSEGEWTLVLGHRCAGTRTDRVLVVHFDGDERVANLTLYGFPL
jgi:hypothetical protein